MSANMLPVRVRGTLRVEQKAHRHSFEDMARRIVPLTYVVRGLMSVLQELTAHLPSGYGSRVGRQRKIPRGRVCPVNDQTNTIDHLTSTADFYMDYSEAKPHPTTGAFMDSSMFLRTFGVTRSLAEEILQGVGPGLQPKARSRPDSVQPKECMLLGLALLCSKGEPRKEHQIFGRDEDTIIAARERFLEEYLDRFEQVEVFDLFARTPNQVNMAMRRAYRDRGFPGALYCYDGKVYHVPALAPFDNCETRYGFPGITILIMVDTQYRIVWRSLVYTGSTTDGTIWDRSDLRKDIRNGVWPPPGCTHLNLFGVPIPPLLCTDTACDLSAHVMKPFPKSFGGYKVKPTAQQLSDYRHFGAMQLRMGYAVEQTWGQKVRKCAGVSGPIMVKGKTEEEILYKAALELRASIVLHNQAKRHRIADPSVSLLSVTKSAMWNFDELPVWTGPVPPVSGDDVRKALTKFAVANYKIQESSYGAILRRKADADTWTTQ